VREATVRDPLRVVAASADAAAASKSARMSMSMDVDGTGERASFTADGAFDFRSRSGQLTMDVSSLGLPGADGKIEVRLVDGVVYLDMSGLPGSAGRVFERRLAGKHWFKLDVSGLAGSSSSGGLGSIGSSDPTAFLDSLRGVSSDVRELGHETVRGVDTTHYAITIDMTKALDRIPGADHHVAEQGLKMLGTGSLPAEVWIDGQGRPRKFVMHVDVREGAGAVVGTLTMELYDYGAKVDVQAPRADDTIDLMGLLDGAFGGIDSTTGTSRSA
jgi:hypothetical protein